jgi:hypothetical protein
MQKGKRKRCALVDEAPSGSPRLERGEQVLLILTEERVEPLILCL